MRFAEPERPTARIGLTPLIDVVFLLIVFFMLASTFSTFRSVPVSGAAASSEQPTSLADVVLIRIGRADEIAVNGRRVALDQLQAHADELAAAGRKKAIVQSGREADVQGLVRVLDSLRRSNLMSVTVVE